MPNAVRSAAAGPADPFAQLPHLPPPPRVVAERDRPRRWPRVVGILGAVVVVTAGAIGAAVALERAGHGLGSAIGRAIGASIGYGGLAAHSAAEVAAQQHLAPGELTPSMLDGRWRNVAWVDGSVNVPLSTYQDTVVGITATEDHVVTAVRSLPFLCSYGLTVTSAGDPVVAADQLPGPGTYEAWGDLSIRGSVCSAASAPASGWVSAGPPFALPAMAPV